MISHIGGRAPAGFGLVVRAPERHASSSASQRPRTVLRPGPAPDRPDAIARRARSAREPATRARPTPGASATLEANGFAERAGVRFSSRYRFRPDRIHVAWQATREPHRRAFGGGAVPELGREATINAILKSGPGDEADAGARPAAPQVDLAAVRLLLHRGQRGRLRGGAAGSSRRREVARLIVPVRAELQPAARAEPLGAAGARRAVAQLSLRSHDGAGPQRGRGGGVREPALSAAGSARGPDPPGLSLGPRRVEPAWDHRAPVLGLTGSL